MEQSQPAARGQSLLEWYEALISAALVLVLVFSFFFRMGVVYYTLQKEHARVGSRSDAGMQLHRPAPHILLQQIIPIGV